MRRAENRPPDLRWHSTLILLPVFLLALFGVVSLIRDRSLVRQEAALRAEELSEQIVSRLWFDLTNALPVADLIEINTTGNLVSPPPLSTVPLPVPFPTADLAPGQLAAWNAALAAGDSPDAPGKWRAFLATQPPDRFLAAGHFNLALALFRENRAAGLAELRLVGKAFRAQTSESGISYGALADLKQLKLDGAELAHSPGPLTALCSNAVTQPTPLTSLLLAEASALGQVDLKNWQNRWRQDEKLRALFAVLPADLTTASPPARDGSLLRLRWVELGGESMLVLCRADNSGRHLQVKSRMQITQSAQETLARFNIPASFGVAIHLAGRNLLSQPLKAFLAEGSEKGARSDPLLELWTPLLSAAVRADTDSQELRVAMHMINAPILFARQRERTLLFGSLIAVATVAALFGLLATRRALVRQWQLNELKSNFVSSVSHELRAPIASVRLMAESLERGKISSGEKQRDYFHLMVQECRRLSALIENVLDFSRIEQDRKQYEFEPANVAALIEQTFQLMEPAARERSVRLEVEIPADLAAADPSVDARALQQALVNLIDNAIKHSPADAVVQVGARVEMDQLQIWVADSGPGIPAAEHKRIFERFHRLGSELRRETPGVGIGLSIVQHIVDAHQGRIRVDSAPGQGSRFTIELPLSQKTATLKGVSS